MNFLCVYIIGLDDDLIIFLEAGKLVLSGFTDQYPGRYDSKGGLLKTHILIKTIASLEVSGGF